MTARGEETEIGRAPALRLDWGLVNRLVLVLSLPFFIALWHLISVSGLVNPALTPSPISVMRSVFTELSSGLLILDVLWSISRAVIGYVIGAALGVLAGVATARLQLAYSLLSPTLQALRPIPPIALVPLSIVWFGLSEGGKYFLVAWGVFFVVWIATFMGVRKIDPVLIRAAQSLGVPERRMLREVLIPGALPYIVVGLRTSVTISFYSLVAAEAAGTFAGIAYRIDMAHQNMQTSLMFGALVLLGVVSACTDYGFEQLSRKVVFWK